MDNDIFKLFEKDYLEAETKDELNFWEPLATISSQFIELQQKYGITKEELSEEIPLGIKSLRNIEQLEEIPEYKVLAEIAKYFKQRLFLSMYGDFTCTLAETLREKFLAYAAYKERDPQVLLSELLNKAVEEELKDK